jgi:hypothetical protein
MPGRDEGAAMEESGLLMAARKSRQVISGCDNLMLRPFINVQTIRLATTAKSDARIPSANGAKVSFSPVIV